ncbi:MAG TPA: SIMPL domain-containing protein [Candidatus Bacteroides avicola]|uniref:SIMPL domain-containing protein n=1 Tax=Candidatus Bacteroides avicola TaxID=2838468 RepID=A0A9D2HWJ6_9BACE|nr:SIMPL domain-containing protein [Candidatus Bacteroides avicola]
MIEYEKKVLLLAFCLLTVLSLQAQTNERYIEVTGTSEIEIIPDKIHYLIEIREYFEEEFDGKSKPEEYRTKVPLSKIEQGLRESLTEAGIPQNAIRTQEIGDYWRQQGQDFLVSKKFDITLTDFNQINEIVKRIDTKGVHYMRIGELENKEILAYHQKGKIEALKAAQKKATYLVEALGKKLGDVIRIVEEGSGNAFQFAQSNVLSSDATSFENFRTIKKNYSMQVRFEIVD